MIVGWVIQRQKHHISFSPPSVATHLSNQCYNMCFRQNENNCAICFVPAINVAAADNAAAQISFGLS